MRKLPFLFNNTESPPWPHWPSCKQPKTLSFRVTDDDILKTLNSSFLKTPELCLITNSLEYGSFSTASTTTLEDDSGEGTGECIEAVIRGLRLTERLFFEPGETSSILEEANKSAAAAAGISPKFKERSIVCSMESVDPYLDFKKSMEEMMEAHGLLKDWDSLEELLGWYLKVNGKDNRGYIVGAFVDLLIGFAFTCTSTSTTTCSCSPSSPLSYTCSSTTTCSSSLQAEIVMEDDHQDTCSFLL